MHWRKGSAIKRDVNDLRHQFANWRGPFIWAPIGGFKSFLASDWIKSEKGINDRLMRRTKFKALTNSFLRLFHEAERKSRLFYGNAWLSICEILFTFCQDWLVSERLNPFITAGFPRIHRFWMIQFFGKRSLNQCDLILFIHQNAKSI